VKKFAKLVDSFSWNEENSYLAYVSENNVYVCYEPYCMFVDVDIRRWLTDTTRPAEDDRPNGLSIESSALDDAVIHSFHGIYLKVKRTDGTLLDVIGIQPFPSILATLGKQKEFEKAVKLCRTLKQKLCWAVLASMSMQHLNLYTAEVAYAALEDAGKVHLVCQIRDMQADTKPAELALLKRKPFEAETHLLSSGKVLACVMMWLEMYQWERALHVAQKYQKFIDVVAYYRYKYLQQFDMDEQLKPFIDLSVEVDEAKVQQTISGK
jgi:intraflagellar transport protein 80